MNTEHTDELKRRAAVLWQEADRISSEIRQAEDLLRQVPSVKDVKWACLMWDHKSKRIVSHSFDGGRPLIECPLKERIYRQNEIEGLLNAVLLEAESFMEKMRGDS